MTDPESVDTVAADPDLEAQIARLLQAAGEGKAEPMYQLGAAYAQGCGVPKNLTDAARWFHEASKRGHATAKTSIAYLYATGQGVRRDQRLAFVLLSEASAKGDLRAADMLFKLRRSMQPAQIRDAEKQLRNRALPDRKRRGAAEGGWPWRRHPHRSRAAPRLPVGQERD